MSFIWPTMLVLLVLIPLFITLYLRIQRRRRMAAAASNLSWAHSTGRGPGARRHLPIAFFLAGLTILLVALARPQTVVAVPKVQGTVILAFDVSGSMAADDLKPTRMDAAKAAAREFVQRQPSTVQIGVVAFSDGGVAMQSPTNDQGAVLAAIDRLAPQRGTSVAQGIQGALKTIATAGGVTLPDPNSRQSPPDNVTNVFRSAVIVLLTDGENNESPDPLAVAQYAGSLGTRINTVGIGSPTGSDLHINGFTVHTQLDESLLQQIAQTTGGTYYNVQSTENLEAVYNNLSPQLTIQPEKIEVTSLFAGAGILVFLVGMTFSLLWFGRLL